MLVSLYYSLIHNQPFQLNYSTIYSIRNALLQMMPQRHLKSVTQIAKDPHHVWPTHHYTCYF